MAAVSKINEKVQQLPRRELSHKFDLPIPGPTWMQMVDDQTDILAITTTTLLHAF